MHTAIARVYIPQILAETACHRPSNVEASTKGSERPHRSPPKSGKLAESLTIMTWNVMGLTTVMHELKQLLLSHSPDVVVITETKLNKRNCTVA